MRTGIKKKVFVVSASIAGITSVIFLILSMVSEFGYLPIGLAAGTIGQAFSILAMREKHKESR
ncbi:MAG: hypothetical protein J6X60_10485 [Ruminiclostridium sp.]|nr:hypothetical protein [Ruminiclostridium sp.]